MLGIFLSALKWARQRLNFVARLDDGVCLRWPSHTHKL